MARRIDTQAEIDWARLADQAGDPASPAAGYKYFYAKAGGIYLINSAGTVLGPIKTVATDEIWDAAGDLVQGTGANTAAKLSLGTANQLLRVNSGATAVEWAGVGRVLISEQTPTGTGTVTWSSIPATFNSLEIEWLVRSTDANLNTTISMYYNNDTTATNYRRMGASFYGASGSQFIGADTAVIAAVAGDTALANTASAGWIKIPYYAKTTYFKEAFALSSFRQDSGGAVEEFSHFFGLNWESASAVSRVDLILAAGNYKAGSTFRLYGVF